jgi:transcriptional regulator with XRE-family HTH domain
MNERLKIARRALGLNQTEFGDRIGVTAAAISKLEIGERNFTDQMILALCKEYNINEAWLRTGIGEMFVVTENALIRQLSEQYDLNAFDRKILEIYVSLPKAHREVLQGFALKLVDAAGAIRSEMEAAEEIAPAAPDAEESRAGWNKGLTREEAHALLDARYDAAEKDAASSTTSAKAGAV